MSHVSRSAAVPPDDLSGPLTLDDLENRADKAYARHMETYTAVTVLHRVHMDHAVWNDTASDTLGLAREMVTAYRDVTRKEWYEAYIAWATAAGFEIPADMVNDGTDIPTGAADDPPDHPVY
ncbi:hypothetical protein [Parafrankia sp. BMG5.11]|uniref:hypothetical protein n=1 Tax=Parafrankia sp. BMG5.11 TaxID=222540 RepID=UPI001040C983|nr:hypothetical protein [Parafrankia sp. BMG5.11]TCJ35903.1 hypothetical protein E0504_25360 [Parafrankia sp. BMG5.11]